MSYLTDEIRNGQMDEDAAQARLVDEIIEANDRKREERLFVNASSTVAALEAIKQVVTQGQYVKKNTANNYVSGEDDYLNNGGLSIMEKLAAKIMGLLGMTKGYSSESIEVISPEQRRELFIRRLDDITKSARQVLDDKANEMRPEIIEEAQAVSDYSREEPINTLEIV